MDNLVNMFITKYGMTPEMAKSQAMFYMAKPDDPMTKIFLAQAAGAGSPGGSTMGQMPIVLPVGGRPTPVTVNDIASGAPPTASDFTAYRAVPQQVVTSPPRDFAAGMVMPKRKGPSGRSR